MSIKKLLGEMVKIFINFLRVLKSHWFVIFLLAVGLFYSFYSAVFLKPHDADNLIALSFGLRNPSEFITGSFTSYFPAYRPLAQLIIWFQYQISGVSSSESYFVINILIWLLCAVFVYLIVHNLTKHKVASAAASLLLFLDQRSFNSIIWIGERQSSLAVLFGLAALFVSLRTNRYNIARIFLIMFLLLAAMLCKEYGIAFAGAIVLIAFTKKKDKGKLILASILSVVIYFVMRFVIASGGGLRNYCEDMGYFQTVAYICYQNLPLMVEIKQHIYNTGASFIGTFMPLAFTDKGQIILSPEIIIHYAPSFVLALWVTCLAIFALIKQHKKALPFLGLIIFCAILNFMLYRGRNQLVGVTGLSIIFGLGLSGLKVKKQLIPLFCFVIVFLILLFPGRRLRNDILEYTALEPSNTYCLQERYPFDINRDVVSNLNQKYNLIFRECDD
ncbi:MAG: glycosyltransferase family 39 protein [Patescibacteria group bacterium]